MELGKLIYLKRKEKGLSQEKLTEEIHVARQTVSKWETNETLPDVESLKKLAIFLEFSIDAALGIEAEKDDDKMEWLIIGGFIIGNSLGLIFDNFLLGFICGMIGLGSGLIGKVFKQ